MRPGRSACVRLAAGNAEISASVFNGANSRLLLATAGVVALLLLITYRSPVLWVVPLLVVGVADRLAAALATHVMAWTGIQWDESTIGILSVLVFGAGTDYALLLISRYRDELRTTDDRYAAMARALRHAGEAVLASATTVVLGLLTLLLSVVPTTRGLGVACAVGVGVAMVFALVVLPTTLVLCGRWVFWPIVPREGQTQRSTPTTRSGTASACGRPRVRWSSSSPAWPCWGRSASASPRCRPASPRASSSSRSRKPSPPPTGSPSPSPRAAPTRRWSSRPRPKPSRCSTASAECPGWPRRHRECGRRARPGRRRA